MDILVRKADIYDVEMISLIGRLSFTDAFGNVFNECNLHEYIKKVYDPDKIALNFERDNNVFFIAEINNRPAGFAKVKRFSLNDEIESGSQMQLEKIYVLPGLQKKGVGNALLKEVIDFANEIGPDYLWLDVYAGNENAIRFYEKNDFHKGSVYHRGFGTQHFEFYIMMLPVQVHETLCC